MGTVTYYFNGYDSGEAWSCSSAAMVDGKITASKEYRAYTVNETASPEVQLLNGNTYDGLDYGKIKSVKLRAFAELECMNNYPGDFCYVFNEDSGDRTADDKVDLVFRAVFDGTTDAASPGTVNLKATAAWTDYVDITNDDNAPSNWSWTNIQNLDCDVYSTKAKINSNGINYDWSCARVYKVEIAVDYEDSKDLNIYYSSLSAPNVINCYCSRFDVANYGVTFETWLKKSDLQTLRSNITPQAVGELYKILGRPLYYDKTWQAENTLRICPTPNSRLQNMRKEYLIYVKNISDSPIQGDKGWLNVKIEGMISGSSGL